MDNPRQNNIIREQYRDSSNLNARLRLHEHFSTNPRGWFNWYMDQLCQPGALPENAQILELGCGSAGLWRAVQDRCPGEWRLVLTDYSYGMVGETQHALSRPGGRFAFAAADAQSIPFADASFDVVLANHMLYHVSDRPRTIREIRRVLRSDGRLFAATNGRRHMTDLSDLLVRLAAEMGEATSEPGFSSTPFSLENGPTQLAEAFARIETWRYPDSLVIREAQPLVDYVMSMSSLAARAFIPEQAQRFAQRLKVAFESEIEQHGAITIVKDAGILIAWN